MGKEILISRIVLSMLLALFIVWQSSGQEAEQPFIEIGNASMVNPSKKAILSGEVSNPQTGELIIGATIYINNLDLGTVTNDSGSYVLILPVGDHEITFGSIGLSEQKRFVRLYTDGVLNVGLAEQSYSLEEIVVRAKPSDQNVSSVKTGAIELSVREISALPTLLGEVDVLKSLQLMPGVSSVGEGAAGINVRGGKTDQNLVMFGGAQLFNTSHALGLFSAFNPDVIESFSLYKGSVPAQYGGRTSSILDIGIRNGSFEAFKVKAGIGALNGRLMIEGPINQGKTSYLLGGRASYANWVLRANENPDIRTSSANYHDLNGVIAHRINNKHLLKLMYYNSYDFFKFGDEFGYEWDTKATTIQLNSILADNWASQSHITYGTYKSTLFEPEGTTAFNFDSGQNYWQAKQNFVYTAPNNKHLVHMGVEFNHYRSRPDEIDQRGENSVISRREVSRERGRELSIYINDEIELSPKLALSLGARYSFFQSIGTDTVFLYQPGVPLSEATITDTLFFGNGEVIQSYGGFEPRAALRYRLGENSSVKVSYNRMRQYIHLISNTAASTPVDVWQLSNRYIEPQISDNYSVGFFKNFAENAIESSIEGFYRNISNQVDYKDFASLLLNPHLETELLVGKGRAFGVEVLFKRKEGKFTGWLSYTFTRSQVQIENTETNERINNGEWYASNFDKPHDITLTSNYKVGKFVVLGFNFTYSTGRPITGLESSYEVNKTIIPHFSERNVYRIPDYYRLDISMKINSRRLVNRKYRGDFTLTFYNLLGRRNPFSVYYQQQEGFFIPSATQLSIIGSVIPALNYNFSF